MGLFNNSNDKMILDKLNTLQKGVDSLITHNNEYSNSTSEPILKMLDRGMKKEEIPFSVRLKGDTHMALKMIGKIEGKPMYRVLENVIENYIQQLPDIEKQQVVQKVKEAQKELPQE